QFRAHQLIFIERLPIVPTHVEICPEAPVIEFRARFLRKKLQRIKAQQRNRASIMHGALRKAQLEFPPETLLKKWRERRIIDGKRPALRRDDFRTKTASRRMLLGRSRRREEPRTEQNHFALQSPVIHGKFAGFVGSMNA